MTRAVCVLFALTFLAGCSGETDTEPERTPPASTAPASDEVPEHSARVVGWVVTCTNGQTVNAFEDAYESGEDAVSTFCPEGGTFVSEGGRISLMCADLSETELPAGTDTDEAAREFCRATTAVVEATTTTQAEPLSEADQFRALIAEDVPLIAATADPDVAVIIVSICRIADESDSARNFKRGQSLFAVEIAPDCFRPDDVAVMSAAAVMVHCPEHADLLDG